MANNATVTADYFISRIHLSDGRIANIADTTSGYIKFTRINDVDVPTENARNRIYLKLNDKNIAVNNITISEKDADGVTQQRKAISIDQTFKVNGFILSNTDETRSGKKSSTINLHIKLEGETSDLAIANDIVTIPRATLARWGVTKLSNAIDSNDETIAATPKAVKTVSDKLNKTIDELNYYKIANDIRVSIVEHLLQENDKFTDAIQNELTAYKKSNDTRVTNLETTVKNNKAAADKTQEELSMYKIANDIRSSIIEFMINENKDESEALVASTKAELNNKIDANKKDTDATIAANKASADDTQKQLEYYRIANDIRVSIVEHLLQENKTGSDDILMALNNYKQANDVRVSNLEKVVDDDKKDLQDYKIFMGQKSTLEDYNIQDARIDYDEETGEVSIILGDDSVIPVTSEYGDVPLTHILGADELQKIEEAAKAGGDGLLQRIAPNGDWVFTTAAGTGTILAITIHGKTIANEGTADIPDATTEEYGATILTSNMEVDDETKALNSKAILDNYIMLTQTKPSSQVKGEFWYEIKT